MERYILSTLHGFKLLDGDVLIGWSQDKLGMRGGHINKILHVEHKE